MLFLASLLSAQKLRHLSLSFNCNQTIYSIVKPFTPSFSLFHSAFMQDDPPSWGMIELQGDIESRNQLPVEDQFVGDLHFTIQGNIPVLIIGHHILYGKTVVLEKPFAVLEKFSTSESTEYIVKAVVKQKILFRTRPKPIIANVPKVV